jgi:hypothetical protein
MPTLRIRRYETRLTSDREIAGVLRRTVEIVGEAPVRFFFEDETGSAACAKIAADVAELAPFFHPPGRMLNFDNEWDIAHPSASNLPVPLEALFAVTASIPDRYALASVVMVLGPIGWNAGRIEAPAGPGPFSTRFPAQTYLSPGLILHRIGSSNVNVTITDLTDDLEAAPHAAVQRLTRELGTGPPRVLAVLSSAQRPTPPVPRSAVTEVHDQFRSEFPAFLATLPLPHEIPDPSALTKVPPEAVGEVRAALLRAFKPHGWRKSAGGRSAGMHRLWKTTPSGRSLALDFDTGSSLRFVTCFAKLVTEAAVFRLPVPADRRMRMQYITPNRQLFDQVVENLTVVVEGLEQSWVTRMDAALGPLPHDYRPPQL